MNITRLNFRESLPLVQSAISRAHFLSLDLQMSGIQTEELTSPSLLDSMQQRYEKQRQSVDKFIPLQFGLSAFRLLPHSNKVIASPFNFYIFPLTHTSRTMRFSFHVGTMNFLAKNSFDFNKLFYEAIPYATRDNLRLFEQQEGLTSLSEEVKRMRQLQSPQVRAFLKMNLPRVEEWVASSNESIDVNISFMKVHSYLLLKAHLEEKYPDTPMFFSFDTPQFNKRSKMTIRKCCLEQKQAGGAAVAEGSDASVGLFNEVFDSIVESKKPLIVHNGFLDLMHVYHRFVEDLPHTWTQYQQKIHQAFPYLYDNKYLFANSPTLNHQTPVKLTGLEDCFIAMRQLSKREQREEGQSLQIEIDEELKEYSLDSLECHQAGFDSLMTGYSFLKGVAHLNPNNHLLADPQAFHSEHQLIRNRVPLGSIKVPFNFESNEEDIYSKDGTPPLYFQAILNERPEEQRICEYFSKHYGPVNFYWTSRTMAEFCISFVSSEAREKFVSEIAPKDSSQHFTVYKLDSIDFLVLTHEQHQQKMNNLIITERKALQSSQ